MTMHSSRHPIRRYAATLALVSLQACTSAYSYKEKAVPEAVKLSERLQMLFAKTKLICFGRYAMEVPQEAQLLWGTAGIAGDVEIINGGLTASQKRVAEDIAKIMHDSDTAEITYNREGPVEASWQIRYYESDLDKKYKIHIFNTYVNKGELTFILGGSVGQVDTEEVAAAKQGERAKSLRLRAADEVPDESGYCIDHAFMASKLYAEQETVNIGIYLPSLPDVAFSIGSNKDAYGDLPKQEFEKSTRGKLSLLARIEAAKQDQGLFYPSRTVLREGKRDVQHWHGEESLIKRADGTHDFEWAFVGTPTDVANPSEYNAVMFTKVEHNVVGAASAASVSDDEAVALWDRLLSGLKFRAKVPGAPEGSYYLAGDKPLLRSITVATLNR
ncbi:MAG: T6SS immunity protein Tli4 family protein [Pseudomonadota bacterium]